jgi:TonB family protein
VKPPARRCLRAWPPTLSGAVAVSAVVHAALFAVPVLQGTAPAPANVVMLEARLAPRVEPQAPVIAQPAAPLHAESAPVISTTKRAAAPTVVASESVAPPAPDKRASDALAQPAPAEAASAPLDDVGDPRVAAQEVVALARLGDLIERQLNDFPREVQYPVRVYGAIEARYPAEARAQGIEGTVLAWVVVDPSANVEEIQIVDGEAIFREAVIEAIRAGRFYSAADGGVGLHFPITLEFRFALDHAGGAPDAPAAQVASAPAADPATR